MALDSPFRLHHWRFSLEKVAPAPKRCVNTVKKFLQAAIAMIVASCQNENIHDYDTPLRTTVEQGPVHVLENVATPARMKLHEPPLQDKE